MTPVVLDTGFLVALFEPADRLAASAATYLREHKHPLVTVAPVVVESCFFLAPGRKLELLTWIRRAGTSVVEVPPATYPQLELTLRKYTDRNIDFADAAIIWLANETGARRILTGDRTDFETYRLKGGKRFELLEWN
jgi:predicted nucleic acid-binding protein